ncbi:MAG: hypothetical protein IJJ11_07465 [Methanosphaera sp.]|nr:hypothetical protein [Methanosphaera sp.]
MTMKIEYVPDEYETIESQEMNDNLAFKLVKFNTEIYGIISYNPTSKEEEVILLSPKKDKLSNTLASLGWDGGLGCRSFMVFARDAKKYLENAPSELVVYLGTEAPDEYREVITKDQEKTLYEKVAICLEIMEMKFEDSFHYKYGDIIVTVFMCITILMVLIAIANTLHLYGVI